MSEKGVAPNFLGIGAQRSGSTWLYENLRQHPNIWMPPLKEIHFFDNLGKKKKIKIRSYRRHLRRRAWDYLVSPFRPTYLNLAWDYYFFFGKRDMDWYKNIFHPDAGQITGEITPSYTMLAQEVVQKIYALNPDLKIIYFMRDPIERDWSSAIKGLARDRKRNADLISQDVYFKKITSQGVVMRGDYLRTLEIWEDVFPAKQIHIDFMDEIKKNPYEVLRRVFCFLGVSEDEKYIPVDVGRKRNSTDGYKIPIPPEIEVYLAKVYLPQLEILNQRFSGATTSWLEHAKKILRNAGELEQ